MVTSPKFKNKHTEPHGMQKGPLQGVLVEAHFSAGAKYMHSFYL